MYALKQGNSRSRSREIQPSVRSDENQDAARHKLGAALDIRQVADLIGCSVWTVRQTLIPKGLPHFRFTPLGRLTFYENQVIQWVQVKQGF